MIASALAGCVSSPDTMTPGEVADAGSPFADIVIAYTVGGEGMSCGDALPLCDDQVVPCGPQELLGAPDTVTHVLEAGGRVDVGFRCSQVIERGEIDSPDLKIWAQVPEGASAVVEVSQDGVEFENWVELDASDSQFDLATIGWSYFRYLRIADRSGGGIAIDAIEALR